MYLKELCYMKLMIHGVSNEPTIDGDIFIPLYMKLIIFGRIVSNLIQLLI